MRRVRVKICGLCSADAAEAAARAGADAIGLVFYKSSSRRVSLQQAVEISARVPPFVTRVALFLDAPADEVTSIVADLRPDMLQFHGRETAAFCRSFGVPYIKAVPMGEDGIVLADWAQEYHDARALLLDAHRAGDAGGQGRRFCWEGKAALSDKPVIVAGGLSAENVEDVIRRFSPYAVDVSSGVESAPGVKDARRMDAFINVVLNMGAP